jgi:hypothetical protein
MTLFHFFVLGSSTTRQPTATTMAPGTAQERPDEDVEDDEHDIIDEAGEVAGEEIAKKELRVDDNAESASTGGSSTEGKGSGSGGGYNADYSDQSSDYKSSDDTGGARKEGSKQLVTCVAGLNLGESGSETSSASGSHVSRHESKPKPSQKHAVKGSKGIAKGKQRNGRSKRKSKRKVQKSLGIQAILDFTNNRRFDNSPVLEGKQPLPQFNGVKIAHPMDPRIDISNVGHILHCSVPALQVPLATAYLFGAEQESSHPGQSLDTYMQLMEVRPPCKGLLFCESLLTKTFISRLFVHSFMNQGF